MPKSKQTPTQPAYQKLNIVTMGGKGGTGKTTFLTILIEWFRYHLIPVVLRDLDVENQSKGGLKYYYDEAEKVNVHTRDGLNVFFDVGDFNESVVIADMGAGQGEAAVRWFADASEQAQELGIGFVLVGVINDDPASVISVLQWADKLQHKARYWIVLNEMHEVNAKFDYWHKSEAAQRFCEIFDPIITKLSSRSPVLQGLLADHGLSLRAVADKESNITELRKARSIALARMYRSQAFKEFDRVVPGLIPEA